MIGVCNSPDETPTLQISQNSAIFQKRKSGRKSIYWSCWVGVKKNQTVIKAWGCQLYLYFNNTGLQQHRTSIIIIMTVLVVFSLLFCLKILYRKVNNICKKCSPYILLSMSKYCLCSNTSFNLSFLFLFWTAIKYSSTILGNDKIAHAFIYDVDVRHNMMNVYLSCTGR